jgi:prolyl oligopeptidase
MSLHSVTLALLALLALCPAPTTSQTTKSPPPTRRDDVREVLHGVEIVDPYRWLEDQDSPETRAWIEAQNAYTHAVLDDLPARGRIRERLTQLLRTDRVGTPIERNGRYFIRKKRAQDDLWILYLRTSLTAPDEVLIDTHTLSADHTVDISLEDISRDGTRLVYGVRRGGEDETELHVFDVDGRKDLPDRLPRALYRGASLADGSGFYYNLQSRETGTRMRYHAMGTDPSRDVEVFGRGYGADAWIGATVSEDGRYVLFTVDHGWARSEVFVQNIAARGPVTPIVTDLDASFHPFIVGDSLVMQTDWQAPDHRILLVDLKNPARDRWRPIVPEGPDAIQSYSLIGGRLFVHYLHNVTSRLAVFALDGTPKGEIALPSLGSAEPPIGRWESQE